MLKSEDERERERRWGLDSAAEEEEDDDDERGARDAEEILSRLSRGLRSLSS